MARPKVLEGKRMISEKYGLMYNKKERNPVSAEKSVFTPNEKVRQEFVHTVKSGTRRDMDKLVLASE